MPSTLFFRNNHFPKAAMPGGSHFLHEQGVAYHNEDTFFVSGVNHGGGVTIERRPNASLASLRDWILTTFGDPAPHESDYKPGTAYKRIHWPLAAPGSLYKTIDQVKLNQSFVSLRILLNKLDNVFQVVEPTKANLPTYGHVVRELLLLACMEVESSWAAVLKENQYSARKPWKTTDYVRLLEPMMLDSYKLSLRAYPDFPTIEPFACWDRAKPTESLPWYSAYNKTKHDREENLRLATLETAVSAVGAAVVMFYAQFGFDFEPRPHDQKNPLLESVFPPLLVIKSTRRRATSRQYRRVEPCLTHPLTFGNGI